LKILYYRFVEDAGVSSSLMALKNEGEGEGSVAFQDTCCVYNVTQQLKIMFIILEDQTLLSGEE